VEQLRVTHAADDDGLWFFRADGRQHEVQLESSSGMCPFIVETDADAQARTVDSIAAAVALVESLVGLSVSQTNGPGTR
jgi:hypothetical protein